MDQLLQDIRYAGRMLRRAPGSSLVALATLALATGLSTSIFTLVNVISLRPLTYANPNELVVLSSTHRETARSTRFRAGCARLEGEQPHHHRCVLRAGCAGWERIESSKLQCSQPARYPPHPAPNPLS